MLCPDIASREGSMTLTERLAQERRARMAAERHLEWKSRELAAANEKLALQARALSEQVVEERQSARAARSEAARLKGQNERYVGDLDRAHTAAVMAERRLRTSIDTIRDGFAVFDGEDRLVLANRALLHPFPPGAVTPGMTYRAFLEQLAPLIDSDLPAPDWIDAMLSRIAQDDIPPVELALRSGLWIRVEDRRARDGDLVSLAIDITGEMRLRAAIEAIPDGFVIFDRDDRLTICNQTYRDIYSAAAPAIRPGARFEDILRAGLAAGQHSDAIGREEEWLAERIAEFRSASGLSEQHLADGRWIRAKDHPTPDGGRVGLRTDISAEREVQETLRAARAAAEAASRAKSAFLANMSHEIRTPMNGVVGMAELLCATDLTEEQRLFAETIRSSGEALLTVINDILDYSKIEAGRLNLHPEPFDLDRLIHETAILLQPQARARGLDLMIDYDMFLPTRFIGDQGRLRQVLTNLMGNAVKFTERGHIIVRVVGVPGHEGNPALLHVTVEDTGIGIAPEHLDHIFGEFNQVESATSRRFEGTGLGLAITRRLIDRMGGEIWVDSEPGKGSCFGFSLSLDVAEETRSLHLPTSLRQVLIFDPNPMTRDILERQLAPLAVAVATCRSLGDVLTRLDSPCDLILADFGEDGADVAALHAALAGRPFAPRIILSAAPDRLSLAEPLVAAGNAAAVLARPVLRSDLWAAVARFTGAETPVDAPPATAPRRLRILAAEDNRTNQLVFAKMLRDLDLDLRFADDGQQALELWQSFRPDIIFMDVSMPVMDGCAAAAAIRKIEGGRARVPILALTAHAMAEDGARIREAGMDLHLTKPLRRSEIVAALRAHCPPGIALDSPAASAA